MKKNDDKDARGKCICRGCALYDQCSRRTMKALFCLEGVSSCAMNDTGVCVCRVCPVYIENNLKGEKFCIAGEDE